MDDLQAYALSKFFEALADVERILLLESIKKSTPIEEIERRFDGVLDTLQLHLRILRESGFVERRENRFVLTEQGKSILSWLEKLAQVSMDYIESVEAHKKARHIESLYPPIIRCLRGAPKRLLGAKVHKEDVENVDLWRELNDDRRISFESFIEQL